MFIKESDVLKLKSFAGIKLRECREFKDNCEVKYPRNHTIFGVREI